MTKERKTSAVESAGKIYKSTDFLPTSQDIDQRIAFVEGVKWADEHPINHWHEIKIEKPIQKGVYVICMRPYNDDTDIIKTAYWNGEYFDIVQIATITHWIEICTPSVSAD